jgi:hypothetical protein
MISSISKETISICTNPGVGVKVFSVKLSQSVISINNAAVA